jgi:hypothetical protein
MIVGKEICMSRSSKFLTLAMVIGFLLACNVVTQPLKDTQNLAETAQAIGSSIPMETLQALPSAIPQGTLEALPSLVPSLEAMATNMPDLGNMMNPQGTPVQVWKEIPVMPQATAGQEFPESNIYSFKANVTAQEVQDFYNEKLTALGWSQPFSGTGGGDVGILFYQKGSNSLTITIMGSEGTAVVILTMA